MESRCIIIPALGRPLYPGMLYDCRSDSFIPGVTLWDKKALCDDLDIRMKPTTHLKFSASDSFSEKANLLDIKASLKASFLGGLVEVGGSAKYLHDTKSSTRQSRVTMQYSQETQFEQLTMNELGNFTYPQVFEQKTATHVVTAVLYGVHIFLEFDYSCEENESKQEIEGNLHAVVKKIPSFSIEGDGSVNLNEGEKKMAENISVTFYGDIELEKNATTYKEAIDLYKNVPILIKQQQDKGVPLTVWLYPLNLLDHNAAKLVREICSNMVSETESLLEEIHEIERLCNDLIKRQITDFFHDLKDRLLKFQALHKSYTTMFKNALCKVLAAIRGGGEEDKALGEILNTYYRSPFRAIKIKKWVEAITTELNVLSTCTSELKDLTVVKSSQSLQSICLDPDVDVVVCLSFTSLNYKDSYLEHLEDFTKSTTFKKLGKTIESPVYPEKPWFNDPDNSPRMRKNLSLFTTFLKANKNEKNIKFIVASIPDSNNPGNSIQLYQNGLLTDPKFQPVSKPAKPVVETSDGKVTLKLSKSPTGETVHFRVEYRTKPLTDSGTDDEEWTVIDTPDTENTFTLTELQATEQYWVRYRAVSDVGVSEASISVPFSVQGKLSVTVDPWNYSTSTFVNDLTTKIMSSLSGVANPVCNPNKQYFGSIPGGLRPGMALIFKGILPAHFDWLAINLQSGPEHHHDIAFQFRASVDGMELNSCNADIWEEKESIRGFRFRSGESFDVIMVINPEFYEIIVAGKVIGIFKHRKPVNNVNAINIEGKVFMNTIVITELEDANLKVRVTNPKTFEDSNLLQYQ